MGSSNITSDRVFDLVCQAHERISPFIESTRIVKSEQFSESFNCSLFFKMEQEQRTGSFKLRGAYNKLAQKQNSGITVVTSSTGNHGLACLDAMEKFRIKGKVCVPTIISRAKQEKLESKGADLYFHGFDCEETESYARQLAESNKGMEYIPPYNDLDIIAGQGTIAIEILRDLPTLDYIFVSVGGGGLMAGVASYIKKVRPEVTIVGCQPEASPVMLESIKAGNIVDFPAPFGPAMTIKCGLRLFFFTLSI